MTQAWNYIVQPRLFAANRLKAQAEFAKTGKHYDIAEKVSLDRVLGPAFWIATVAFILACVLIAVERLHRTIAAMLGAAVMMCMYYTIKRPTGNPVGRFFVRRLKFPAASCRTGEAGILGRNDQNRFLFTIDHFTQNSFELFWVK